MKFLRYPSRIIIGCVFIFSGFAKAIDPLGSVYKFSDYFEAFNIGFLVPLGFILAVLLSSSELLIGLNLLYGIRLKITGWILMVYMSFFLVLTLIIAITNPVTDCGCFGDALILTNWQTFWKNVIFYVPTLVVFLQREKYPSYYRIKTEWAIVILLAIFALGLNIHTYRNLPLIDFRPYKVGTSIPQGMSIPEGAKLDEYQTILIYEKDGVMKEFEIENIPYEDSTWKWVETRNILIEKGYEPPIHDFNLTTKDGEDITANLLSDPEYSLLVIAYDLEKTSVKGLDKVYQFAGMAQNAGVRVYGMTASTWDIIDRFLKENPASFDFFTCDDIMLKTLVRANPGAVLLRNGYIIGKWHFNNLPSGDFFQGDIQNNSLIQALNSKNKWVAWLFILMTVSLFIIIQITRTD